jgi:hypothetical protein
VRRSPDVRHRPSQRRQEHQLRIRSHYRLGAELARNELRSPFSTILPAIEEIALDGEPATMTTTFVGGHETLPISHGLG